MRLGMIGLGRMGANMARRLMRDGHECVVHDVDAGAVAALEREGAAGASSPADLAARLAPPRAVWLMVPAERAGAAVEEVAAHLSPGDVVVDGGNTHHLDDPGRAAALAERGIDYVDVGTSGGVLGLERGYCLMIGGPRSAVELLEPVFRSLAPGVDAAPRTPGREGDPSPAERGYLHCGPAGAGHFVKMVHNGIEYGLMAAYAEGMAILERAGADLRAAPDAGAAADPARSRYDIDTAEVAELWRRGSVVSSWLLDLTAAALADDPALEGFEGRVADSGEGRWTAMAAVEEGVPAHVLTAALYGRFASRGEGAFGDRLLSAMRRRFGGHDESPPA